eukprot:365169-Chlamydomonas_euryale.AAC.8
MVRHRPAVGIRRRLEPLRRGSTSQVGGRTRGRGSMEVACSRSKLSRGSCSQPQPALRRCRAVAGCARIAAVMFTIKVSPSRSLVAKGTGAARWLKPRRPPSRVRRELNNYFA